MFDCPGCGSAPCHHRSNLVDETPFALAAQSASELRHFGETKEAIRVLGDLGLVRIVNFLRPRWLCLECGAKFDG